MMEINKNTEQLSGLVDIYAVPTVNIKKIENHTLYCYKQDNVFHFMAAMESISHSDQVQKKDAGYLHNHKLSFFIPGQSHATDQILNKMKAYKYVVVVRDQQGNYFMIANVELNLDFEFEYANSANYSGVKGYNIQFSGNLLSGMKTVNFPFLYV